MKKGFFSRLGSSDFFYTFVAQGHKCTEFQIFRHFALSLKDEVSQ